MAQHRTVAGFDWDSGNREKCQKHGVSRQSIESLFKNGPFVFPDIKHSKDETRLIAIGKSARRSILVVFTFRNIRQQVYIRPISARFMHKKEVAYFTQFTTKP